MAILLERGVVLPLDVVSVVCSFLCMIRYRATRKANAIMYRHLDHALERVQYAFQGCDPLSPPLDYRLRAKRVSRYLSS